MALILDTGPIVALLDAADPAHQRCVAMISDVGQDLVIPTVVLVEVDYWLHKLYGEQPWRSFVEDIDNGAYRLLQMNEQDLLRAAQIAAKYDNLDLGLVDAVVIASCERLGERKVATLDRRDFSVVRPRHCERLELLPD